MKNCPVCNFELRKSEPTTEGDKVFFNCHNCGRFYLSGTCCATLPDKLNNDNEKRALLAFAIRKMQNPNKPAVVTDSLVDQILKGVLPNPIEQADNLLVWLAENDKYSNELKRVKPIAHQAIVGATSPAAFSNILNELSDEGLIKGTIIEGVGPSRESKIRLSFKGWRYYDNLIKGAKSSKRAFMAMQYGVPELDKMFDAVFKKACKEAGFDLFKLDDPGKQRAGLIDDRLRVEIRTSRFMIADLTHDNKGAYWEAGFAEGLGKPVIYTCEIEKFKKMKTHFDTNHHLTIRWDIKNKEKTIKELKATIRATLPDEAKLTDD